MTLTLQDKIYGCIAGGYVGSAMGSVTEGLHWKEIQRKHGLLEDLLGYQQVQSEWKRPPGTTEGGAERQKVLIEAIIRKGDRIQCEDLRAAWLKLYNEDAMREMLEPYDIDLYNIARTSVPAKDIGKYCDYSSLISFSGSCQPIGLINAGNAETTRLDILNVGQIYQISNGRGLRWAEAVGCAIAEATRPNATVQSVLEVVYASCDAMMLDEIPMHIEATKDITDVFALREYFEGTYNGQGVKYVFASANEIVTKALCIFQTAKGDMRKAILAAVNMGRGAAATATVAGALNGSFYGIGNLPKRWVDSVDEATQANPNTCVKKTIAETTDGLHAAFLNKMEKQRAFVTRMDID